MNISKRSKTLVLVAAGYTVLFAGLLINGVYLISAEGSKLESTKVLISEQSAKEAAYTKVTKLVESTEDSRAKIKNLFITENETISFLASIEKAADSIGVILTTNELVVIPSVTKDEVTNPALLSLRLSFSGAERDVKKFLLLLEKIPYHSAIPKVTLNTATENWKATVDLNLTLLP